MVYPEGPPFLGVPPYSDFIAYFQSENLYFSAGEVLALSETQDFNDEYDLKGSFTQLVEKAKQLPYDGLVIDLRAISAEFAVDMRMNGLIMCLDFEGVKDTNYVFCKFP